MLSCANNVSAGNEKKSAVKEEQRVVKNGERAYKECKEEKYEKADTAHGLLAQTSKKHLRLNPELGGDSEYTVASVD